MSYLNDATGNTPAHLIYVIDASGSMEATMPGTKKRKIDFISDILEETAYQIYVRSRRGSAVSDRYKIAVYAYNDQVNEVTNGKFISIKEFLQEIPEFGDLQRRETNTLAAFQKVRGLLGRTIPELGPNSPTPIICHLTDGEYTEKFGNPSSLMKDILNLDTPDGKVLLENIFLGNNLLVKPVADSNQWEGVQNDVEISNKYAKFLYDHSSTWPDRYIQYFNDTYNFQLSNGTKMFFPAEDINMVKMAFTASAATPTKMGPNQSNVSVGKSADLEG